MQTTGIFKHILELSNFELHCSDRAKNRWTLKLVTYLVTDFRGSLKCDR